MPSFHSQKLQQLLTQSPTLSANSFYVGLGCSCTTTLSSQPLSTLNKLNLTSLYYPGGRNTNCTLDFQSSSWRVRRLFVTMDAILDTWINSTWISKIPGCESPVLSATQSTLHQRLRRIGAKVSMIWLRQSAVVWVSKHLLSMVNLLGSCNIPRTSFLLRTMESFECFIKTT